MHRPLVWSSDSCPYLLPWSDPLVQGLICWPPSLPAGLWYADTWVLTVGFPISGSEQLTGEGSALHAPRLVPSVVTLMSDQNIDLSDRQTQSHVKQLWSSSDLIPASQLGGFSSAPSNPNIGRRPRDKNEARNRFYYHERSVFRSHTMSNLSLAPKYPTLHGVNSQPPHCSQPAPSDFVISQPASSQHFSSHSASDHPALHPTSSHPSPHPPSSQPTPSQPSPRPLSSPSHPALSRPSFQSFSSRSAPYQPAPSQPAIPKSVHLDRAQSAPTLNGQLFGHSEYHSDRNVDAVCGSLTSQPAAVNPLNNSQPATVIPLNNSQPAENRVPLSASTLAPVISILEREMPAHQDAATQFSLLTRCQVSDMSSPTHANSWWLPVPALANLLRLFVVATMGKIDGTGKSAPTPEESNEFWDIGRWYSGCTPNCSSCLPSGELVVSLLVSPHFGPNRFTNL